jgi:hypothetical protein
MLMCVMACKVGTQHSISDCTLFFYNILILDPFNSITLIPEFIMVHKVIPCKNLLKYVKCALLKVILLNSTYSLCTPPTFQCYVNLVYLFIVKLPAKFIPN